MACHSHSTDTSAPKSSKRMRFMTLNNNNVPTSSSVSEVVEEKQIKKVRKDLKFKVSIDGVLRNGGFDPPKMEDSSKLKFDEIACKKKKEHGIFKSGQALGGHKRSHFVGGGEDHNNNSTTLILKQDSPPHPSPSPSHGVPCLIDLNLPAPVDE
ncbi:zinc finger protein ZAT4-like [Senna tora]|uniref:Zinc finger protein ZAT4-like n=1 Tax=Senna tora TaxID=362788 RepID=A0A834WQE5_9FABA|nr:zinc finger protein ZAT4-like [Senna tora]